MDVLYIVREGDNNEELRYSLRALEANYPHDKIFIAGYKPSWVKNVIALTRKQLRTKYENAYLNFYHALHDPRLSEDFVRMNDDFFIMKPIDQIPTLHRGTAYELAIRYENELRKGAYFFGVQNTIDVLERLAIDNPKIYECHTPMVFNKDKARRLLKLQQDLHPLRVVAVRTLYGNYFNIGGKRIKDPKVDAIDTHIPKQSAFLSTNDNSFSREEVGEYIRDHFPNKSKYER